MANDLVSDSVFDEKRKERKLSDIKSVPAHLGAKAEINATTEDTNEKFCGCAKNHKILDESNARIVGGKEASPNSLPWQAFLRIKKVKNFFDVFTAALRN